MGLDLTDPAIWASGIDALAEEVDEAERLAAELGLGVNAANFAAVQPGVHCSGRYRSRRHVTISGEELNA